jgi:hypothetical protein
MSPDDFEHLLARENERSPDYGGRSVTGAAKPISRLPERARDTG